MIAVLSVPYALAPVDVDAVGAAEVVLAQIDAALVERGHRSLVAAPRGSRVHGSLISTGALPGVLDDAARAAAVARTRGVILDAVRDCDIDVVHLHGLDIADVMPPVDVPILITLHLPVASYPPSVLRGWADRAQLACVSSAQADGLSADLRNRVAIIDNGVDLDRYRPRIRGKSRYLLTLGRICPETNYVAALDAARRVNRPIVLAGRVHPYASHVRHYEADIAPRLGRGARFVGEVSGARKLRLIAGAHCLLVPSTVAETSSLVAIEALASGTPVVAYRSGALGRVVEHGRTGFVVGDVASMAEAIERVGALDRGECRAAAERRFDLRHTTSQWIALLETLARPR